ncbi:MAG: phosphatidylglycerophosphatase A [Magnetovibrio sp.]|nr:phosphatidylglycerophosphatase A [Magnetovibrio sp.]
MQKLNVSTILSTWFGVGYIPIMPGTAGSLIALPIAWIIIESFGHAWFLALLLSVLLLGIIVSDQCRKRYKEKDPSRIVIDEVVGQWVSVLFIAPDILYYSFGFVLFRFFDILKPWPISWVDQHIENGLGIMLDDVLAGIFSLIILVIAFWLFGI